MKRFLSAALLLLALSGGTIARNAAHLPATAATRPTATVYVCMNKGNVYHLRDNCAALLRCTHEVKQMSAEAAQQIGRRACFKCD